MNNRVIAIIGSHDARSTAIVDSPWSKRLSAESAQARRAIAMCGTRDIVFHAEAFATDNAREESWERSAIAAMRSLFVQSSIRKKQFFRIMELEERVRKLEATISVHQSVLASQNRQSVSDAMSVVEFANRNDCVELLKEVSEMTSAIFGSQPQFGLDNDTESENQFLSASVLTSIGIQDALQMTESWHRQCLRLKCTHLFRLSLDFNE